MFFLEFVIFKTSKDVYFKKNQFKKCSGGNMSKFSDSAVSSL